jgi:hypothetical protein
MHETLGSIHNTGLKKGKENDQHELRKPDLEERWRTPACLILSTPHRGAPMWQHANTDGAPLGDLRHCCLIETGSHSFPRSWGWVTWDHCLQWGLSLSRVWMLIGCNMCAGSLRIRPQIANIRFSSPHHSGWAYYGTGRKGADCCADEWWGKLGGDWRIHSSFRTSEIWVNISLISKYMRDNSYHFLLLVSKRKCIF